MAKALRGMGNFQAGFAMLGRRFCLVPAGPGHRLGSAAEKGKNEGRKQCDGC